MIIYMDYLTTHLWNSGCGMKDRIHHACMCMKNFTALYRDQSACASHRRVPGPDGELQDQWLQYRPLEPGEDKFSLRNKQVK